MFGRLSNSDLSSSSGMESDETDETHPDSSINSKTNTKVLNIEEERYSKYAIFKRKCVQLCRAAIAMGKSGSYH